MRRMASGRNLVSSSGSKMRRLATSAALRMGLGRFGPASFSSRCMPMASAGIKISEKTMIASTPRMRNGCKDTSAARSGVLQTSRNGRGARTAPHSGRYRPAWRIIQTGTRVRASPRQARRKRSLRPIPSRSLAVSVFSGGISPGFGLPGVRRENSKSGASLLRGGCVRYVSGCSRGLYSGYRAPDISAHFTEATPEGCGPRLAWNQDEPSLFHTDTDGLLVELGMLPGLSEYWQGAVGKVRDSAIGAWAGGALFRVAGTVARLAHRSLSRPLRLDVVIRMAAGADVSCSRVLSSAALGRGVRGAVYSWIFFDCAPGARGPAIADSGAWRSFRLARHAQYPGIRGLRAVVRVERDLSRGRAIVAKPQAQQRSLALAVTGIARAHEPLKRARGGDFHRHWHA